LHSLGNEKCEMVIQRLKSCLERCQLEKLMKNLLKN
jgi:hypothetical protein